MMGRAGRPQFEKTGLVVIMTERYNVDEYEKFLDLNYKGREIESNFLSLLEDNLINEISLRTVKIKKDAYTFFKSSFAFWRLKKKFEEEKKDINKFVIETVDNSLKKLEENDFLTFVYYDNRILIDPTFIGNEAARQNVSLETSKSLKFQNIKNLQELLKFLSLNKEFENFRSRIKERKFLKKINKKIKFPIKKKAISTYDRKVYVILQTIFLGIELKGWELKLEKKNILKISFRLLYFLRTYFIEKKKFYSLFYVLKLIKYLKINTSDFDKFFRLKQNFEIKKNILKNLISKDIISLESFLQNRNLFFNMFPFEKKENLEKILIFDNCFPKYKIFHSINKSLKNDKLVYNLKLEIEINNCQHKNHKKTFFLFKEINNPKFELIFGYFFNEKKTFFFDLKNPKNFLFSFINSNFCGADININSLDYFSLQNSHFEKRGKFINNSNKIIKNKKKLSFSFNKTAKKIIKKEFGSQKKLDFNFVTEKKNNLIDQENNFGIKGNENIKKIGNKENENINKFENNDLVENINPMQILRNRKKFYQSQYMRKKNK